MCASELTVRVERAPELSTNPRARVSIFGVFHDGRMSEASWGPLEPKLASVFGGKRTCEVGYGKRMRAGDAELTRAVDRMVRENGIDDEVLGKVAPAAEGDLIMVLMLYRKLPARLRDAGAPVQPVMAGPTMGRRMARPGGMTSRDAPPEDERVFELSASLFSRAAHKLVAQVDLRYTGDDLDEAMGEFAKKLGAVVPEATCTGWKWPDPDTPMNGP
jgi:hypothetical protein